MMRRLIYLLFLLLMVACNQLRPLLHHSERGKYESSFRGDDSLFSLWKASYDKAMKDPLPIVLPYVATMQISDAASSALVYKAYLRQGQRLIAELTKPSDSTHLFMEFSSMEDTAAHKLIAELNKDSSTLSWVTDRDDSVRISLQPMIADSAVYHLKIYLQPAYHFPVLGKNNSAIQSFWGADRDGGVRRHEGIDIFAASGTPVLAVADGRVGFAGERGKLGGKQVWLREKQLGFNVYYAHLDSIAINSNAMVELGDTLGFVGNTGNAAGGPPHLHFGVYGNQGAVDPLHFVKQLNTPSTKQYQIPVYTKLPKRTRLHDGPSNSSPVRLQLEKGESIKIMARSNNWLHIIAKDTIAGFIAM
ncbi:peptidoglycan DD-metalloendopeptidase family protein [Sphingobacterium corticis]|uniref:Peptidoglycan DD-metalloendopeptidase family protein n=1 Tax=Sphingobacterium corticis TaxID=1812823 RepID=A0ABW5NNA2_9SPHI